jgi:RHS repeat-associated protein
LQEEGYYPFGLEMKAISSTAAMKMQTRYKFNGGTELETSFDVDYYETYFRQYDAQIGRFTGVDALAGRTRSISPYQFGFDNPVLFNDPSGLLADAEWNEFLNRYIQLLQGNKSAFGEHGGYNDGSGFTEFGSDDEAFGYGSGQMSQNGWWGTNSGWASSPGDALNKYNGGHVTTDMVQGLMTSYLAPRNPEYIKTVHQVSA